METTNAPGPQDEVAAFLIDYQRIHREVRTDTVSTTVYRSLWVLGRAGVVLCSYLLISLVMAPDRWEERYEEWIAEEVAYWEDGRGSAGLSGYYHKNNRSDFFHSISRSYLSYAEFCLAMAVLAVIIGSLSYALQRMSRALILHRRYRVRMDRAVKQWLG